MMYHKNRLIKAYEKVSCQRKVKRLSVCAVILCITSLCHCVILHLPEQVERKGVGVIGVIECNFLQPTHNKQDFDDTDKYRFTMRFLIPHSHGFQKILNTFSLCLLTIVVS